MKGIASSVAFFGLSIALMPALAGAQGGKDDANKTDEKKADTKKKALPKVDDVTLLNSPKLKARVKEVRADVKDGDAQEIVVVTTDPQKFGEYLAWEQKFLKNMEQVVDIETKRPLTQQQKDDHFRQQSPSRLDKAFTGDVKAIAVTPSLRIRTATPPPQFDSKGLPKKLTPAELAKLKDRSRLPGYPADISAVRMGQIVELYVPKSALPAVKSPPPAKKGVPAGDPNLAGPAAAPAKMDAYLLYVLHESP